ncbi:MAG: hypothetical protein JWQ71_4124 [Pedosphaera sp.]|nr:hypothetical protein [Pedosphaera sp.]
MKDDMVDFLNLKRLPARLTTPQTAMLLGFPEHDIPVIVRANLLKPLGNPVPNATKYFAASEIEGVAKDRVWLTKATKAIYGHWAQQNLTRKSLTPAAESNRLSSLN